VRHFEFLNSVFTKNLEMSSSSFYGFLFQNFLFFFKFSNSLISLSKTNETGSDWFLQKPAGFLPVFQSIVVGRLLPDTSFISTLYQRKASVHKMS
jgi:hypothetical protein